MTQLADSAERRTRESRDAAEELRDDILAKAKAAADAGNPAP
jgi:hypothetical protein